MAVVDVEQSEPAAIEADQLLRGLLLTPQLSGQAWVQLINLAHQAAILQGSLTRASITRHLTEAGVDLAPQPDFRPDIDRLRGFSAEVIARLRQHRSVIGDGTTVHIDREFAHDLRAATDESLLITGDPGAGKSGALAELVDLLGFADVVAFSADALAHVTSGDLRSEIGLDHNLGEVLTNWTADRPGYVVIDALDVGRGSQAQHALMELIATVTQNEGRWKVVATVRRFDLRYSPVLKELFPLRGSGVSERFKLTEFSRVRHFNIGALAPGELAQLDESAPHLGQKVRGAAAGLQDLLRNPFNLRLFAELVSDDDHADPTTSITSRLQLLNAYWERRVLDSAAGSYRRENLVRRMGEEMMSSGVLTLRGAALADETNADDIAELLRVGLLVEELAGPFGGVRFLAFAHHVLFDYAVARLFLSGRDIRAEVASNPTSLFLVRPSYQMYFEGLWWMQNDRQDFWALALSIADSSDVPEIAKVIAPAVAATLVAQDQDLEGLLIALDAETVGAASTLQHLVLALLTDEAGHAIPGDRTLVWATFAESVSRRLDVPRAIAVRNLVRELTAVEGSDEDVVASIGRASRRLLRWTWADSKVDRFFTHSAISGVVCAYAADPTDTVELIRAMIAQDHLARYGYIEVPLLADTVPDLLQHDPVLVRDIYVAAFGYEEHSTDATEITRGILNMSSNRRQDYNHSHYSLAGHFAEFLQQAPSEAIEALGFVYERYASRHAYRSQIEQVMWAGESVSFVDDYLFEDRNRSQDKEAQMLNAFGAWLASTDGMPEDHHTRYELAAETLRSLVAPAGLWRVLLSSISDTVDLQIVAPLLRSPSSILSRGLTKTIGKVLRTRFASIDAEQRLEIEDAIMSLDSAETRSSRIRARLIGLLPEAALQTDAARSLWRAAQEEDIDSNGNDGSEPSPDRDEGDFDRAEELHRYGIDPDGATNAAILREAEPVMEFNEAHLNETPSSDTVRDVWPRMRALWSYLRDPLTRRDASTTLLAWSYRDLARAIDALTRSDVREAMSSEEVDELIEITVSLMTERTDEPEDLDDFDAGSVRVFNLPTWVIQASVALLRQGNDDGRLEALVHGAAVDPSPSVRFTIAGQMWSLRDVRPDLVDATLATMEAGEQSGNVLARLANTIAAVEWDRPDQLVRRLHGLHARAVTLGARGKAAREKCSELAAASFIRHGSQSAEAFLADLLNQATSTAADFKGIEGEFRNAFAAFGADRDEWRARAFPLAVRVVERASSDFAAARDSSPAGGEDREQADERIRDLAHLIDAIGDDVYFSSGAYERRQGEAERDRTPPIADYYESARDLLLALPEVPFPSVVHHVLETLDYLSPANPAQVFRDMTQVILRGRAGGYEYDQMAASFVTGSVSRFLVQHRHLLQTDPELRTCLIRILDTFVAVGWGDARMLTYQLDNVFR